MSHSQIGELIDNAEPPAFANSPAHPLFPAVAAAQEPKASKHAQALYPPNDWGPGLLRRSRLPGNAIIIGADGHSAKEGRDIGGICH